MTSPVPQPPRESVTQLLAGHDLGAAAEQLLPLVYDELRRMAQSYLSQERAGHTLPATALVHEAYLRLVDQTRVEWQGRAHFLAVAAVTIRRILIDHARGRNREKRGGGQEHLPLEEALSVPTGDGTTDVLELHDALERLADVDASKERVITLRFFGGMTMKEIAEVTGVSLPTVERQWRFGKAWLYKELNDG